MMAVYGPLVASKAPMNFRKSLRCAMSLMTIMSVRRMGSERAIEKYRVPRFVHVTLLVLVSDPNRGEVDGARERHDPVVHGINDMATVQQESISQPLV